MSCLACLRQGSSCLITSLVHLSNALIIAMWKLTEDDAGTVDMAQCVGCCCQQYCQNNLHIYCNCIWLHMITLHTVSVDITWQLRTMVTSKWPLRTMVTSDWPMIVDQWLAIENNGDQWLAVGYHWSRLFLIANHWSPLFLMVNHWSPWFLIANHGSPLWLVIC